MPNSNDEKEVYDELDFPDSPEKIIRFCIYHSDF
jgi:hypothetical protein